MIWTRSELTCALGSVAVTVPLEAMAEWSEDLPGYAVLYPQDEIAMHRAE